MDIFKIIAEEIKCDKWQVEAAVKLIDEGNTIPFISRYRKEVTGSLDDSKLRDLNERLEYLRNLEARKSEVLSLIEEQGKLTGDLREKILAADKLVTVEDLYRPYKQKRKTRADIAKKRGLEPLADFILAQATGTPIEDEAAKYVTGHVKPASDSPADLKDASEKEVPDAQAAIAGAKDIIAERISDDASVREHIRAITAKEGVIVSRAKDPEAESVYTMYYDFSEPVRKIADHRILAINRGESEGILSVSVDVDDSHILIYLNKKYIIRDNEYTSPIISSACEDAYSRLIQPSIEREIRAELKGKAEDSAIKIFEQNLNQLLMQPPITGCTVLGWDPAFRTGCKTAVVDDTGKVLDTVVVYPTAPHNKVDETKKIIKDLISRYGITLISIGNGTASRESEQIVAQMLKEIPGKQVQYVITNEAGASVYSASKLASEESPEFDVGQRSAVSIARRVQDPLAELVKIDPKSIGVGQYQHDMNQKKLGTALDGVVEDAVNRVGVDLNTASASLLAHISGITDTIAKNIVTYRDEHGKFKDRRELMKVAKLGPKAYEQCAGFCRINGGKEVLDSTSVHPESYAAARELLKRMGCSIRDDEAITAFEENTDLKKLAEELGCGEITLKDIFEELKKPARDPRADMPKPVLKSDVMDLKDLTPGMKLKGTVRNVIDFGAFVDIGVHQDGLVHISQMADRYIKHPLEVVSVGDIVEVTVLEVDEKKGRISLSMKGGHYT